MPRFLLGFMLGALLAATYVEAGPAATPADALEPLAEHLPPPAFTRDHEAWLNTMMDQFAVLTRRFQTLPPDAKPQQVEAMKTWIESVQSEQRGLEAMRRVWEAYSRRTAAPPVISTPQDAGQKLNHDALIGLYKEYWASRSLTDGAATPGADTTNVPSARQWEQLADRFEAILRTAQTTEGPDGALALHGRLLQGACYLSASVIHFGADQRDAQLRDYLRGVRVLDWVAQHEGIAPAMPSVGDVPGYMLPRWPYVHLSMFGQPTLRQARELLSDFCPWGAETYVMLTAGGLMNGFDWRALPPYGSEKVSVATTWSRWLPQDVERDMQEIVTGVFAARMGAENFRWWKDPEPTYTIWYVSPRAYGIQASTILGCTLKVNKLVFGGPEALLIDLWKDMAFDHVGQWFGQGGGIHWALGHGGNLLGISVISPFWLDPKAGWTFLEKGADGVTQFKPSKMFSPDWGDLLKGALMDVLRYVERAEIDLLFDSIRPDNAEINAAFGDPKTYNGSPMPAIIIRADVMGWQVMPDDRYRRYWHIVRYYRFDRRAVFGLVGLSESQAQRAARKAAEWQDAVQWPARSWQRLAEPYGMRLHLNDFSPKAQVVRFQIPKDVLTAWEAKATRDGKILRAELVLPGEMARLGPIRASLLPVSEDLHVTGIDPLLNDQERQVRSVRNSVQLNDSTPGGREIGGEATFILVNAPMLPSEDDWVDVYAQKLWLLNMRQTDVKIMLRTLGVKPPPRLPHLLTEYTVRILLESPQTTTGPGATAQPEQLAETMVRLLPRPSKPVTGDATDLGPGYLMVKQRYEGPVPKLEAASLPFRRCIIKVKIGSDVKKVHTYSDELKNPKPTGTHVIGTQGPTKAEDWEGWEKGMKEYVCTATGSFRGNTFTGTWKDEKKSATFKETQTGQMTVTLGDPAKRFPENATDAQAVLIPSQVTSFQASLRADTDASTGDTVYKTSTDLAMSGSGASLHNQSSTLLAALPWRLRTIFDMEQRQRQLSYTTLNYLLTGSDTASKIKIQWNKTLTYTQSQEQQTLTNTQGEGTCTVSFMFF